MCLKILPELLIIKKLLQGFKKNYNVGHFCFKILSLELPLGKISENKLFCKVYHSSDHPPPPPPPQPPLFKRGESKFWFSPSKVGGGGLVNLKKLREGYKRGGITKILKRGQARTRGGCLKKGSCDPLTNYV